MATTKKDSSSEKPAKKDSQPKGNNCPECGLPPSTSQNGPDGTTAYTCATGHQWDRKEG